MPRLTGDGLARFKHFLESFHSGTPWAPLPDDWSGGLVLPVPRSVRRLTRSEASPRRLLVVCFRDGEQGSGTPELFVKLAVAIMQDPELCRTLAVDAPDLERYVDLNDLSSKEKPPCASYEPCHIVSSRNVLACKQVVAKFLLHNLAQSPIIVVGVGIGAYIGLTYAIALREMGGFPWLLYAVQPPAVFPAVGVGSAGPCDFTCLVSDQDAGGERWRFEAATSGRFQVEAFKAEDGWLGSLLCGLQRRAPFQALPAW